MLPLAGKASIRRRPVTSTLGSARRSGEVLGQSLQQPIAAPAQFRRSSLVRCRRPAASPAKCLAPARTRWSRRPSPPRLRQAVWPVSQRLSICQRCQSSFTAAQPVRHSIASARPCRLRGARQYCQAPRAFATSNVSAPLCLRHRACQRRKALPNMSVNRSLHGMAPGPRSARCPCCASRPRRHAVPARLPLR